MAGEVSMFNIPPAFALLIATIAGSAITAVLIKVLGPPLVAFLNAHTSEKTANTIRSLVDGLYKVGAAVAAETPTSLDDDVVKLIGQVDEQFKALHGRPMSAGEIALARTHILATHATEGEPDLGAGTVLSAKNVVVTPSAA